MYDFKINDEPFAVGFINSGSDSIYISTGAGYVNAAKSVKVSFDADTYLPYLDFGNMACTSHFANGQGAAFGLLDQKAESSDESAKDYRFISEKMKPYDLDGRIWSSFSENEIDITASLSGWGGTWGGHAVPDLIDFARLGTNGLRKKIALYKCKNPGSEDFYTGLLLTLDAVDIIGKKIYESAKDQTKKNSNGRLKDIMEAFSYCPKSPARTFAHAVYVYVTVFSLDGIDSPGHFDQYMIDFWRASPYEESRKALEDLWVFFHKTRTWNLCISGSDENWNDLSNELTYEILDVARKFKFETPNLTMRCHKNTPHKLWREAAKTVACGLGMPTLYNDEAVCPALEGLGIPSADSHRYVMNGCNQIDIQGKSHMGLEDGEINMGLALSYALFGGYNIMQNKQIGAVTPPAEQLDTFEKFCDALKLQLQHLADAVCSMANKSQRIRAEYSANPLRSLTTEGCIEKGLDYKNKGPLYGHGQILFEGVPDCIDSLANIHKFVYDDKKYTLSQVRDALSANYEGYEKMNMEFKTSNLKFGNDDPYVDKPGAEIVDGLNAYLRTKKTERGGYYCGGCSPFERAANNGIAAGPLPNGKKKEEHIYGDSIGATPGRDTKGPTALLNSCLAFDHTLPASGFILNLKFEKSLFATDKGIESFVSLVKAYFAGKGQQISASVVCRDDLLDALEHPEDHRDIIVRVGGFSTYFVNLSRDLQENIIARTYY